MAGSEQLVCLQVWDMSMLTASCHIQGTLEPSLSSPSNLKHPHTVFGQAQTISSTCENQGHISRQDQLIQSAGVYISWRVFAQQDDCIFCLDKTTAWSLLMSCCLWYTHRAAGFSPFGNQIYLIPSNASWKWSCQGRIQDRKAKRQQHEDRVCRLQPQSLWG